MSFGGVVCVGAIGCLEVGVGIAVLGLAVAGGDVGVDSAASGVGGFGDFVAEAFSWCSVRCCRWFVGSFVVVLLVLVDGVFRTLKAVRRAVRENILGPGAGRLPAAIIWSGSPGWVVMGSNWGGGRTDGQQSGDAEIPLRKWPLRPPYWTGSFACRESG